MHRAIRCGSCSPERPCREDHRTGGPRGNRARAAGPGSKPCRPRIEPWKAGTKRNTPPGDPRRQFSCMMSAGAAAGTRARCPPPTLPGTPGGTGKCSGPRPGCASSRTAGLSTRRHLSGLSTLPTKTQIHFWNRAGWKRPLPALTVRPVSGAPAAVTDTRPRMSWPGMSGANGTSYGRARDFRGLSMSVLAGPHPKAS